MWISDKIINLAEYNLDVLRVTQEELAVCRSERDTLKVQLATLQTSFDWLRMQVNTLQYERAALMDKAYGIKVPSPEIARTTRGRVEEGILDVKQIEDLFSDMGDDEARIHGLPNYNLPTN